MGFDQREAENLLADTGRHCCICGTLHKVQLHHIEPSEEGGSDDIDNAIPLCPNCHDEVHARRGGASGVTTRQYTSAELKLHRQRTIERVRKERAWKRGSAAWRQDKQLVLVYAQCLDRPAFRMPFHQELSFSAFDQAMEDTLLALNTGYWRTRDGAVIDRAKGKMHIINSHWREKLDSIASTVEEIRTRFREAIGFTDAMYQRRHHHDLDGMLEQRLRGDSALGHWMDERRNEAIVAMNEMLREIGHPPLAGIS